VAFEPIPRLAKKPELSAGQACGILKYHRLALLDSYVFKLIKSETASLRRSVNQFLCLEIATNGAVWATHQNFHSRIIGEL